MSERINSGLNSSLNNINLQGRMLFPVTTLSITTATLKLSVLISQKAVRVLTLISLIPVWMII